MKNLFKTLIAVAVVSTVVTSCKKGDDDPALSLRSRKARFAGEWKVATDITESTSINTSYPSGTTVTTTIKTTEKYDGVNYSSTSDETVSQAGLSFNENTSSTGAITEYMFTIEKDGTWSSKKSYKITSVTEKDASGTVTFAVDETRMEEMSGTWAFLGANKTNELKNKEAVVLSIEKVTTSFDSKSTSGSNSSSLSTSESTYAPNEFTMILNITQLANKEMAAEVTFKRNSSGKNTFTFGGSSNTTQTGPDSFEGTSTMTFTQE